MRLNKNLYILGDVGEIPEITQMIKNDSCGWLYFVYRTERPGPPLKIGTLRSVAGESGEAVILGVAPSWRLARKLAMHIILKAFSSEGEIEKGLERLSAFERGAK